MQPLTHFLLKNLHAPHGDGLLLLITVGVPSDDDDVDLTAAVASAVQRFPDDRELVLLLRRATSERLWNCGSSSMLEKLKMKDRSMEEEFCEGKVF